MAAKDTNHKPRLAIASQQSLVEIRHSLPFPLPGEAEFPSPPAMANALLRLELSLSAFVADLQEITNIIRSDIGLTAQLLRLAAREIEESPDRVVTISEIVVHVGVEKLRALVAGTMTLPDHFKSHARTTARERLWMHSRLTALVAEELAGESSEVRPEEAHLVGLLSHLGDLPSLLGWTPTGPDAADHHLIGYRMAKAWGFSRTLADVIGGDREVCLTRKSRALLELVTVADIWASRLEFLAARESPAVRAKNPPYGLGRG